MGARGDGKDTENLLGYSASRNGSFSEWNTEESVWSPVGYERGGRSRSSSDEPDDSGNIQQGRGGNQVGRGARRESSRSLVKLGWRRFVRIALGLMRRASPKAVMQRVRNCYDTAMTCCKAGYESRSFSEVSERRRRQSSTDRRAPEQSIREHFKAPLTAAKFDTSGLDAESSQDYHLLSLPRSASDSGDPVL